MNGNPIAAGQIPLPINLREKPGFDLIVVGDNVEALQQARRAASGISRSSLYLWGQPGCGISHLLHASCILADEQSQRLAYIPLADNAVLDPRMLENLDDMDFVCIDDMDAVAGQQEWELALLHLYNRLRESGTRLMIGAHDSPQAIALQLADLKSRMAWDLVYHIRPLRDTDKVEALQRRALARGFELPREVAEYIVNRSKRDMPSLIACLDELENASLVQQRKLTIPFVKTILVKKSGLRTED
jgi:DnaA family protein